MTCLAVDLGWKGMTDNVVTGDFQKTETADGQSVDAPLGEPERQEHAGEVHRVGFESRKCPPGSAASHEVYGFCEVIWAHGFDRCIRYWTGDPAEPIEEQAIVDVRTLAAGML